MCRCCGCPMGVLGNRTAFHMIFDCQLSRGRARAPGCQRCFEAVLIRTAIRFSSTAAALPSHASSMHHDTPSEEVAVLAHAYGTGRTCLYRSAGDARLAGRLHARAQGSGCGGDWRRAAACCATPFELRVIGHHQPRLTRAWGATRSSTLPVSAAAGALRARAEPAGQSGVAG